jgi:predicted regulator of Ras-like GTPase activity (Roadblock/LC7/MglB family)
VSRTDHVAADRSGELRAGALASVLALAVPWIARATLFAETLRKVVDNVDGGIAAVVMGLDGIPVDSYSRMNDRGDVTTIAMEFSFILAQVRKAGESLQVGALEELAVRAERLVLICRMISPQYFVAVVVAPEGNFGKARYLARLATPALVAQL